MAVHQTLLFRQWTDDLVLFTHTGPPLTEEQAEQLAARGIRVVTGPVERLETAGDRLTGVRMQDGSFVARSVLVAGPRMVARSAVLRSLGLSPVPHPLGGRQRHRHPGPGHPGWAQGLMAAAALNGDLIAEETQQAVAAARAS
jgi:hypothetical protein